MAADPLRVVVEHLRDAPYDAADDQLRAITLEIVATLKVGHVCHCQKLCKLEWHCTQQLCDSCRLAW